MSKQRELTSQVNSDTDLCEMFNAEWNRKCDLSIKLNNRMTVASSKVVILVGLVARMTRLEPKEAVPRYQMPFS